MAIDVVCLGEVLIDFFAPNGVSLRDAANFERAPGGAPANVAVALARLGVRSGFIGKVGEDPFGDLLLETLEQSLVDTTHLKLCASARTTLAWVAKPNPLTSEFLFYRNPGADMLLEIADLDPAYLQQAKIFHFGSVSLSACPSRETTLHAAKLSRDAGVLISYDPNWRPSLWHDAEEGRDWILQGLALADLVKVNDTELEFITGTADYSQGSRRLLDRGAKLVIVTLGAEGAYFATRRMEGCVPGFSVEVLDTTGSGDAFVAAFLSDLLRCPSPIDSWSEENLRQAILFANAAGALSATRKGVIPALATRPQIEALMARN